jgi:hypothetical protein
MLTAVYRFLTEHAAAFEDARGHSNIAYDAYEKAYCFLDGFTLENKGLTPSEVKELLKLMGEYSDAQSDEQEAERSMIDAVRRLDSAFSSPHKAAHKR